MELYEFVKCKSFFDHVSELVDDDSNGQISLQEWVNFFNDDGESSKYYTGSLLAVIALTIVDNTLRTSEHCTY